MLPHIYGALFFGVPNEGLNVEPFIPLVRDGPNRFLVESLRHENSRLLKEQHGEFVKAFGFEGSSEIYCFYETKKSRTLIKVITWFSQAITRASTNPIGTYNRTQMESGSGAGS